MAKLRTYLNKDERHHVAIGFLASESYHKILEGDISKEERRCLTKTNEWWEKYAKALFVRVGEGESKRLINEFSGGEIGIKRNMPSRKLHDIQFDAGDVHELAGPIIESHCRNCTKTGPDAAECSINVIFRKALVPTIEDLQAPNPDKQITTWKDNGKTYQKVKDTYPGPCPYKL